MGCQLTHTGRDFVGVLQAGGVLLACPDSNVSSAAVAAVLSSLSPGCGHCLQQFDMPQLAAMNRAGQGSDLAGQAQKSLVETLQGCSHAVVVVEGIESTPSALLPVFINALTEHGHFEHNGKQVPAWNALVVATIAMRTGDLQQVQPAEWLVSSLLDLCCTPGTDQVVKGSCNCLRTASIANTEVYLEQSCTQYKAVRIAFSYLPVRYMLNGVCCLKSSPDETFAPCSADSVALESSTTVIICCSLFALDSMLLQVPEDKIEKLVKKHMVHKLTSGISTSEVVTHAAALRRYVSPDNS